MVMILALSAATALAAPATAIGVAPWSEAIVSVEDIVSATRLFREVGGWTIRQQGRVDRAELDYWKLPPIATATFQRLCAPKVDTGCLRFVSFKGVAQRPIRRAARAWDTGGIYSVMVRSDNVPALFEAALKRGWWAEAEPIRFNFGASDLRNIVLVGPHGINLAVYERISPPFTDFPVGRISQGFNSMRMVKTKAVARGFFEKLGFGVVFDSNREPTEPAWSNFGVPFNFTTIVRRSAAAMLPVAGETGRVELMQIEGFTGRDLSEFAVPPNLGILSVRYPVADLAAYRSTITSKGAVIAYARDKTPVAGLGTIDLIAVRDPNGSITEFYQGAK